MPPKTGSKGGLAQSIGRKNAAAGLPLKHPEKKEAIPMKIAIVSLGCPKNQVDADVMCHALITAGHITTPDAAEADCIIINTCGFIQSAKEEAIENILAACALKEENPALKVIVTGCLAERYQAEIRKEIPEVDAVVGLGSNAALPAILARLAGEGPGSSAGCEFYGPKTSLPLGGRRVISTPAHYAYLKIAEGCSNGCYYCAIPLIRGPLRSRPLEECVAEAKWLAGEGVKELVLVAQDPTAYGEDRGENQICALLDALGEVDGIEWIRILYAYPERITDEFVAAMARNPKVLPYLDLPIQHCSDPVLKAMNRRGDRAAIEQALARLRAGLPGAALRTTLLVGYPGETEEQFAELCGFVRAQRFDRLGCFGFSPEEGTVAAGLPGQLDEETKQQRVDAVMRIQAEIMAEKQAARVGSTLKVLCDGFDEESGLWLCRSAADAPEIDANVCVQSEVPLVIGEFYDVLVEESDVYDLYGVLAEQ